MQRGPLMTRQLVMRAHTVQHYAVAHLAFVGFRGVGFVAIKQLGGARQLPVAHPPSPTAITNPINTTVRLHCVGQRIQFPMARRCCHLCVFWNLRSNFSAAAFSFWCFRKANLKTNENLQLSKPSFTTHQWPSREKNYKRPK